MEYNYRVYLKRLKKSLFYNFTKINTYQRKVLLDWIRLLKPTYNRMQTMMFRIIQTLPTTSLRGFLSGYRFNILSAWDAFKLALKWLTTRCTPEHKTIEMLSPPTSSVNSLPQPSGCIWSQATGTTIYWWQWTAPAQSVETRALHSGVKGMTKRKHTW